ncbi:29 kDa ribonucleoprotein, chloroplastic [Smittium culicis]|uniref:29 kDa ribonucleoprotein, chloroplastic n=1 Tax=Smittium culicis TaxID=133412 RepID=A0A1R1YA55_9FUNG|nr:29 kDa ribonucleoprotein, chloroplastic [Smittium culicis]
MSTYADSAPFNKHAHTSKDPAGRPEAQPNATPSIPTSIKASKSSPKTSKSVLTSALASPSSPNTISNSSQLHSNVHHSLADMSLDSKDVFDYSATLASFDDKKIFFWGLSKPDIDILVPLSKELKAIKFNVDPGDGIVFSGDISFKTKDLTMRAFSIYNGSQFQSAYTNFSTTKNIDIPPPQTNIIKISQISKEIDILALYDILKSIGPIYKVQISPPNSKNEFNSGFVTYFDEKHTSLAIDELSFVEFMGSHIHLKQIYKGKKDKPKASITTQAEPQGIFNSSQENNERPIGSTEYSPASPIKSENNIPFPKKTQYIPNSPVDQNYTRGNDSTGETNPDIASSLEKNSGRLGGIIVPGKLFVTNLSLTVSHSELFDLFKKYGYVNSARVSIDPNTGKSRGHGIVQMGSSEFAEAAMSSLNGVELKGHKIVIHFYEHIPKQNKFDNSPQSSLNNSAQKNRRLSENQEGFKTPTVSRNTRLSLGNTIQASTMSSEKSDIVNSTSDNSPKRHVGSFSQPKFELSSGDKSINKEAKNSDDLGSIFGVDTLNSLSVRSRAEILAQKLISKASTESSLEVPLSIDIVAFLVSQETEFVIDIIKDSKVLKSQYELAKRNYKGGKLNQEILGVVREIIGKNQDQVNSRSSSSNTSSSIYSSVELEKQKPENVDEESENFIKQLTEMPEAERKRKLGSRLFPLIKDNGDRDIRRKKRRAWASEGGRGGIGGTSRRSEASIYERFPLVSADEFLASVPAEVAERIDRQNEHLMMVSRLNFEHSSRKE